MGHSIYFLTATWLAAQSIEPQPMMPGMSGMSSMNGHCSSCQNGGMNQQMMNGNMGNMNGMGSGRRFFGSSCQGQSGIFHRMGNRMRGFVDRCLGEEDDSYGNNNMNHNMSHMQTNGMHNHGMQNNGMQNNGMQMGQRPGMGNMHEMNSMPTSIKVTEPPLADAPSQSSSKPKNLAPITFRPHGSSAGNIGSNAPSSGATNAGGTVVGKSSLSARMADKVGHENDFSWITGQLRRENNGWVIYFATPETIDRYNGRLPIASGIDMSKFQDGDLVTAHGQVSSRGNQAAYQASSVDLIEHDAK